MRRVMIVGGAGAGKSRLARRIGEATGLPVVHIDRLHWLPGWIERPRAETDAAVRAAAAREAWVIEGNYSSTFAERLARADMVVVLDPPAWLRLWRVLRRTALSWGRTRPDMAEGCPERLDAAFIGWVLSYERRGGRAKALALLDEAPPGARRVLLRSGRDARRFLRELESRRPGPSFPREDGGRAWG